MTKLILIICIAVALSLLPIHRQSVAQSEVKDEAQEKYKKRVEAMKADSHFDVKCTDEEVHSTIQIDSATGKFKFEDDQSLLEGRGDVEQKGCVLTVTAKGVFLADYDYCSNNLRVCLWINGERMVMNVSDIDGQEMDGEGESAGR